jgi:hypothetical protein
LEDAAKRRPTVDTACQVNLSRETQNIITAFATQTETDEVRIYPACFISTHFVFMLASQVPAPTILQALVRTGSNINGPQLDDNGGKASAFATEKAITPCSSQSELVDKPATLCIDPVVENHYENVDCGTHGTTNSAGDDVVMPSRVLRKMLVHSSGQVELQYGSQTPTKPTPIDVPGADARRLYQRLLRPNTSSELLSQDSRSRFDLHLHGSQGNVTSVRDYIAEVGHAAHAHIDPSASWASNRYEQSGRVLTDSGFSRNRRERKLTKASTSKYMPAPVVEAWTDLQAAPVDVAHRALSRPR